MSTRLIMIIIVSVILSLVFIGTMRSLAPGERELSESQVGWYVTETGQHLLVTWNPEGDLHIMNFATRACQDLVAANQSGKYEWRVEHDLESPQNRTVQFVGGDGGEISGLSWHDRAGETGFLERDSAYGYAQEEIEYFNGSVRLVGLLMLPRSKGPHPAVVFIHGSGDSTRTNLWALEMAHQLAMNDIAVLLPDKRGSGKSEGDWREVGFDVLADDAISGVDTLLERREIDPDHIGILGLSQGGRIAPLAATSSKNVAFVVNVSGSAVTFREQVDHEVANTTREAGFDEQVVQHILELNALAAEYVTSGAWEPYARSLEQALESDWAVIAEGFPQSEDSPRWDWLRLVADYDPVVHWREVEVPALIIYGEEDEHDNVPVADSVRRLENTFQEFGKENFSINVFESTGHALRNQETQLLRDDFLHSLIDWIEQRTATVQAIIDVF